MPYRNLDIQTIFPENVVHWKLLHCPKRRPNYDEYRISIELQDKKRQYTCVSFEELFELVTRIPIEKRCFYEHISRGDVVKFYLDYEYYKNDLNAIINSNKALMFIQQLFVNVIQVVSNNKNISIDDMLLLNSSSKEKESYHLILDNENIRFSDNHCLHQFVTETLRITLLATMHHDCLRNKNNIDRNLHNEISLFEIIDVFKLVWLEWFSCINCKTKNMDFNICDVCNLFVYDQKGYITPCIDLKVYGIEQDFRMFMCTKRGEERPLMTTTLFGKEEVNSISSLCYVNEKLNIDFMKTTLKKSLITEPTKTNSYHIELNGIRKWATSIGFNIGKRREQNDEDKQIKKKNHYIKIEQKVLAHTEYESYAEFWARSYLESIGSSGVIHSINTGKHSKFIMCNIRNMNICKEIHEDYFNDTTIYINLNEKQFSIRCNHIPCNTKKTWIWQPMI